MCGITGFLDLTRSRSAAELEQTVVAMRDTLRHRGPDDAGAWVDPPAGIALGQRRLSIVDLSPLGHQPMRSSDGRLTLVYNGEIYNHAELRGELEALGHRFRGHSDTEVLLAAVAAWGVRDAVARFNGMFAFAVWDAHERTLTLVRDRVGIKPLFYGRHGQTFLFGSELKALRAHPEFRRDIDRDQLAAFVEHGYVPSPGCIYQRTRKLPPGHMLTIRADRPDAWDEPVCYWNLTEIIERALTHPSQRSPQERRDELQRLLTDSVRRRLVADVPVGTFLSGGIDSSLVTAVVQSVSNAPVQAFTIGFDESAFDESPHATAIARHLGVQQVVGRVTAREAQDVIPLLPTLYDEPFADSSQIPTYLLSQVARREVTVCLSGDGGDELFCGYDRYPHIAAIRRKIAWVPRPLRTLAARTYSRTMYALGRRKHPTGYTERVCAAPSPRELYTLLNRHWTERGPVVVDGDSTRGTAALERWWPKQGDFPQRMSAYDAGTYLPDDILTKVDRASMAVALEARVPLLDHRIVELAWEFSLAEKVAGGTGKQPLRSLLAEYVPPALFERPKMGFGIPLGDWLRGPLREWSADLLDADRLKRGGCLRPEPIQERWSEHLSGERDWHYPLWNVLMFEAWRQEQT